MMGYITITAWAGTRSKLTKIGSGSIRKTVDIRENSVIIPNSYCEENIREITPCEASSIFTPDFDNLSIDYFR